MTIKLRAVLLIKLDEAKILKTYGQFGQERIDLFDVPPLNLTNRQQEELVLLIRDAILGRINNQADITKNIELTSITPLDGMFNLLKADHKF